MFSAVLSFLISWGDFAGSAVRWFVKCLRNSPLLLPDDVGTAICKQMASAFSGGLAADEH